MSPRYLLFLVLTLTMTAFLVYGTYMTSRLLEQWKPEGNLLLLPAENALRVLMIAACLGLGLLSGLPLEQLGWVWQRPWLTLVSGGALGSGLALCFYYATQALLRTRGRRFYSDQVLAHIVPASRSEFFWVALAMLGVATLEELLFRSLLLGGFTLIAPAWLLLLGTAALFGVLHRPQGLWGASGAGLAGLFFGLLFFWSGSVLLPWVAHYVTNMAQLFIAMQTGAVLAQAAESSSATGAGGSSS